MIKTLTSWRGIFALCIVRFHFATAQFDQMAFSGVLFFFMTSGFLAALHPHKLRDFYHRRLWRIFPLHWLALAGMIALDLALMHKFTYGWDLAFHITLLQSWFPSTAIHYGYNNHSWFLSTLLACIIATPLLMKWIEKSSLKQIWTVMGLACLTLVVVCYSTEGPWLSYTHTCPVTRIVDYTLGMALATTITRLDLRQKMEHISLANASLLELMTLAVFAAFIVVHHAGNPIINQLYIAPLWWVPVMLLITTSALLNGHEGLIGKILTSKLLLWLGGISFEIYILQQLVNNVFCYVIAPLFGKFGIIIYNNSFAWCLPLIIVTSWIVHQYFTKPIAQLTNNKMSKK